MSIETLSDTPTSLPARPSKQRKHPLHNITPDEISQASSLASRCLREREKDNSLRIRFKNISLSEPPKALLLPYLDAEAAGVAPRDRPYVPRCVEVVYAFHNEQKFGHLVVSLDSQTEVDFKPALKGQHSSMDR